VSARVPIVINDTGNLAQLKKTDRLSTPTESRVEALENKLRVLVESLVNQGIELPDELLEEL